jgi:predicted glycoside hydrolase/deacetylase ChbG (UPF0249 family)
LDGPRSLLVVADDFGIGLPTSQGILDLAARGVVTGAVLLSHSPHAAESVALWQSAGKPLELGWHPCLTLDRPVLPPERVPTLIDANGGFRPLGAFLRRLLTGRVLAAEIAAELKAQLRRFVELVGRPPRFVNSHHHVQVFPPVGAILADVLRRQRPAPYLRRVREPWHMIARIPGARLKRGLLSLPGRRDARRNARLGFPGNDWLAGVTDPACVHDPDYLVRWLGKVPGRVVELACHPGHRDETLVGRDCTRTDGMIERRVREFQLLADPRFAKVVLEAGFRLTPPSQLVGSGRSRDAA